MPDSTNNFPYPLYGALLAMLCGVFGAVLGATLGWLGVMSFLIGGLFTCVVWWIAWYRDEKDNNA